MTANQQDDQYSAGTVEPGEFLGDGKKSGHGIAAWLPAPADQRPDMPPWPPPSGGRQVIALLDSGVQPHDWLPAGNDLPFVADATEYGWLEPLLIQPGTQPNPPYGTHWGHATFIAGLIRMTAPSAQVLSMRVMDAAGKVKDGNVINALTWLDENHDRIRTDVVLMAFGRHAVSDDGDLGEVRKLVAKLSAKGVQIVASAGNDGSDQPVYPAAFATDNSLRVVSVGAYSAPNQRAPFSDYGPWVQQWRKGAGILSSLPLTSTGAAQIQAGDDFDNVTMSIASDGYAWWSGTSFAAAIYAGQLASQLPAGQGLPKPAAGP